MCKFQVSILLNIHDHAYSYAHITLSINISQEFKHILRIQTHQSWRYIYIKLCITQNQSIKWYSIKHKFITHHQEISSLSIQD